MSTFNSRGAAISFATALFSSTALPTVAPAIAHATVQAVAPAVHYQLVKVDGIDIFYREAGAVNAPVVLLLHGFPISSPFSAT